jgi:hypothetical protein
MDRRFDPPHRIGGKSDTPLRIKALHSLHQADVPLGNDVRQGQAIAAISHRDFSNES